MHLQEKKLMNNSAKFTINPLHPWSWKDVQVAYRLPHATLGPSIKSKTFTQNRHKLTPFPLVRNGQPSSNPDYGRLEWTATFKNATLLYFKMNYFQTKIAFLVCVFICLFIYRYCIYFFPIFISIFSYFLFFYRHWWYPRYRTTNICIF